MTTTKGTQSRYQMGHITREQALDELRLDQGMSPDRAEQLVREWEND